MLVKEPERPPLNTLQLLSMNKFPMRRRIKSTVVFKQNGPGSKTPLDFLFLLLCVMFQNNVSLDCLGTSDTVVFVPRSQERRPDLKREGRPTQRFGRDPIVSPSVESS